MRATVGTADVCDVLASHGLDGAHQPSGQQGGQLRSVTGHTAQLDI